MKAADNRLLATESAMQKTARSTRNLVGALGSIGTAYAALSIAKATIDRVTDQARATRLLSASATEAGMSFDMLAAKNAAFAKSVGLSNTAAAETTSNIARLASGSGMTGQMDQLLQSFADLGAARGIAGEDLNNLIGTILSGQDEGLNRLGISDPGKLYEAYAKSVGRSTESLTQQEKVQAAVNAVMQKAALFTGAAEDRMNSFDGQIAKTTAQWDTLLDSLAMTAITSGPVVDFFNEVSRAMEGVSAQSDQVRQKLREGMSPKDIAAEVRGKDPTWGDSISSWAATALEWSPAGNFITKKLFGNDIFDHGSAEDIAKGRLAQFEAQIAATKRSMEKQDAAAADVRNTVKFTDLGVDKEAIKQREAFLSASLSATQSKLAASYSVAEAMLKNHLSATQASEIQSIQATTALKNRNIQNQLQNEYAFAREQMAIAKPEERAALEQAYAAKVSQAHAEMQVNSINAQVAIREQMKRTKEEISSIFLAGQADNPFVAIFDQGRLAIDRVKEATMGLNPQLRAMLLTLTAGATATAAFGQALENKLLSSNLRNDARQFAAGKLDADTPRNFQENLERQLKAVGATGYAFGRSAQEQRLIDKQVIALTQGIDPSKLTRSQQSLASSARLNEAASLDAEQQQAKDIQAKLLTVLTNLEGNKALEVVFSDPANRTTLGATSANVNARYKQ